MRLRTVATLTGLLITSTPIHAYDLSNLFTLTPALLQHEDSAFVGIPAVTAGFVGITPGVIVGIPLAAVGGTVTTLVEGNPGSGAAAGMMIGTAGGYQLFSNAVGVPLWAVKGLFYDLPGAALSDEQALESHPTVK